jgi:hypothetical protein
MFKEKIMEKNKRDCCIILAAALVFLPALAGCDNSMTSPAESFPAETYPEGQGKIVLSVEDGSEVSADRTVYPELTSVLHRVEIIYGEDSGQKPVITDFEGDTKEISLFPGRVLVKVFRYFDLTQPPVAAGTEDVEIHADRTTHVTIPLILLPITADFTGEGYVSVELTTTFPKEELSSWQVSLSRDDGEYAYALSEEANPISVKSGYYLANARLTDIFGKTAIYTESVWVLPKKTTLWELQASNLDFFSKEGKATINLIFDPDNPPVITSTVREVQQGDVIRLKIDGDHSYYSVFVDGVLINKSQAASYTILTDDWLIGSGSHALAVIGYNETGIPWSTSIKIRVIPGQDQDQSIRYVTNAADLNSAISDSAVSKIVVTSPISTGPLPMINRPLTIGNGELVLNTNGSLLTVESGGNLLLQGIMLKGKDNNTAPLVFVLNGKLVVDNSRICGNTVSKFEDHAQGSGIYLDHSELIITNGSVIEHNQIYSNASQIDKAGGSGAGVYMRASTLDFISGNIQDNSIYANNTTTGAYATGGGVAAEEASMITLHDGAVLRGNKVSSNSSWWTQAAGGAIWLAGEASKLIMRGGVIAGNCASSDSNPNTMTGPWYGKEEYHELGKFGGAICLSAWGGVPTMTKTNGVVYGFNEAGYDSEGYALENQAGDGLGSGHAVYTGFISTMDNKHVRDTTVTANQELNSTISGPAGGWE